MAFTKATKAQSKLRMALSGPSGSGKTYTALVFAKHLAGGKRVRLIDTERGSASKYADIFDFDVEELTSFHPQRYIDAIQEAQADGECGALVIDSLSHAWSGKDGALELVDRAAKRSQSGNTFGAWREVTPLQNQLVDTMLGADCHVIVTLRAKQDYVQERDEKTGRTVVRKIGLAPVQREGIEFEFDVFATMDDATIVVNKSRCPAFNDLVKAKPGREEADILLAWLSSGEPAKPRPEQAERAGLDSAPEPSADKDHEQSPTQQFLTWWNRKVAELVGLGQPEIPLPTFARRWSTCRDALLSLDGADTRLIERGIAALTGKPPAKLSSAELVALEMVLKAGKGAAILAVAKED